MQTAELTRPGSSRVLDEDLIIASEIPSMLPPPTRGGKPLGVSAIWRWICEGRKLRGGRTVRLQAVQIGRSWYSSRQAVKRFLDEVANGLTREV